MTEAIIQYLRATLPIEVLGAISTDLTDLEDGNFQRLVSSPLCRELLGHDQDASVEDVSLDDFAQWTDYLLHRLNILARSEVYDSADSASSCKRLRLFVVGLASLFAFLQSNVTGPPLSFQPGDCLLPAVSQDAAKLNTVRGALVDSLAIDGEAPYKLIPNIELFCFARTIFSFRFLLENLPACRWAKLRIDFLHQRLLSDPAPKLEASILDDIATVELRILDANSGIDNSDIHSSFLLEKASILLHHGLDKQARSSLAEATKKRNFSFQLTGLLGKRTKYQIKDTSQLVVLARSVNASDTTQAAIKSTTDDTELSSALPTALELNDDTLLESISFSKRIGESGGAQNDSELPSELKDLDPDKQPLLNPLDAIILLSTAASITNTTPADGLTREETLPFASRVLDGGSSNWQVYTQALLIRSRIEGYKSRTVERGLLQLQALVDQVIAETSTSEPSDDKTAPTTFLPRPAVEESASAGQRLLYIFQLCSPMRWELEKELANRWINLGGLRSALEIYQRLEMWPEVALCWAGIDREENARQIVRKQLYHATGGKIDEIDEESEKWTGEERMPLPIDAPRLYCILGDLDQDPSMYEKAWDISKSRYFRAQKSLGRYWYGRKDYAKASLAFSKAVKVKQLDHGTWFALGCTLLELNQFPRAVEVFSRAVQLEDSDPESWSNLAVAILNLDSDDPPNGNESQEMQTEIEQDDETHSHGDQLRRDPQRHRQDALKALKQAAKLKRESYRIWENILTVAISLYPPSYIDVITAQQRIIEIRGSSDGEKCIDVDILRKVVDYVTSEPISAAEQVEDRIKPGINRMLFQLVERSVTPLITSSSQLWLIVAQVALWRNKPSTALDAQEKAWRVVTVQPGWEHGTEQEWDKVVNATVKLVEAYRGLGPREKIEGMAAGSGELVCKEWKFKARSAVRGILGRGKASWENTAGWTKLKDLTSGLSRS